MKRIGKKNTANSEYKMRSLSMLFTSKITNDSDFDANVVVVVLVIAKPSPRVKFMSI